MNKLPDTQLSPPAAYEERILEICAGRRVLEIGSGRFPFLIKFNQHGIAADYHGVDVDGAEIARSPVSYPHFVTDVSSDRNEIDKNFDVIFSRFVCEHIRDAERFYCNIYELLNDEGVSLHLFPNLFSAPFLANFLMSDRLSTRVLGALFPKRIAEANKFPAFYQMCHLWGTRKRLLEIGYREVKFHPFYGHHYLESVPVVNRIARTYFHLKQRLGVPFLAEYFILELRK